MSNNNVPVLPNRSMKQVVDQYRVVAYLAHQIWLIHHQCLQDYAQADVLWSPAVIDYLGSRSARAMDDLNNILHEMDAITENDAWTFRIFRIARATWLSERRPRS